MVVYDSAAIYIQSATTLKGKIEKMDAIIAALEDAALDSASKSGIDQYSLDDGQSKIMTKYRSLEDINASITAFEMQRQRYVNRLNGRQVRLVDGRSLRRGGYYGRL